MANRGLWGSKTTEPKDCRHWTGGKQLLVPINPKTLAIDTEQGIRVRPEHIHLALREFAGIQSHPFSKQFPLEVATKDQLQDFWK